MSEAEAPRRGRRRKDAADSRAAILKAANAEFLEHGYDSASMRGIARRAGVDPALVHHYFDDKSALFIEGLEMPARPQQIVQLALAAPRDRMGEAIVRALLTALDPPPASARLRQLLRTALGHDFAARMLREFYGREVLGRITAALGTDDAELRATLAASQIAGLFVLRFGLRVEPLASASIEEVVARVGPVLQWHLVGFGTVDRVGDAGE